MNILIISVLRVLPKQIFRAWNILPKQNQKRKALIL